MAYLSITDTAHQLAADVIQIGDACIDATAGNGHDTLALAHLVGNSGKVIAFDIQPSALTNCRQLLQTQGLAPIVELIQASHENIDQFYPPSLPPPRLILFNLGYLPGGDKAISTTQSSTLSALENSWKILALGGRLIVVCYPGHPAGALESSAVEKWFQALDLNVFKVDPGPTRRPAPYILYADKKAP